MTLLALAKKVYPHRDWVMVGNCACCVERYTSAIREDGFAFNPERNPAQLLDVLCWLMATEAANTVESDLVRIWLDGRDDSIAFYHDNTPQSLAAAIAKAAVRVAGEGA